MRRPGPQRGAGAHRCGTAASSRSGEMERVVITGIGLITPNGIGTDRTWRSVLAAESGIAPIRSFDARAFSTRIAGEVKGFSAEEFIPRKKLKEMGRFIQLSIAAS